MKKKRSISLKTRDSLVGTLFMSPWLIGLLVFTLIPFIYSVWLSLCSVEFGPDGMQTAFVGGRWYKEIFSADAYFLQALKDTLQFIVLFMPMILVVAIICALLLNKALHGRTFFRILFFFPVVVISGPVMEKLISNQATAIISADTYYVYQVIENLPAILSTPLMYIFDNIVLILWYAGVQMLIVLAGLQKIGDSLYEAASIDGASAWQSFWKITLPYLRPDDFNRRGVYGGGFGRHDQYAHVHPYSKQRDECRTAIFVFRGAFLAVRAGGAGHSGDRLQDPA